MEAGRGGPGAERAERTGQALSAARAEPPVKRSPGIATLEFDEVEIGEELPELVVDITPTVIVSTAIATRDYQDVHHDRDLAQQKGSKDIFMNILSTNGFVGRFVTDWAGPEALLKSVAIRLGAPNYPGDTMTMTGRVTAKEVVGDEGLVELEVVGRNGIGDHVTGTVRLALPL
jgi:acyl dehydratase